jgi:hypothetical protein
MLKYHIQTVELTSAQSSISFNGIPQDFTDIYFSISGRTNQADNIGYSTFYVNNSTSNWSARYLQGNSSAVASASTTSIPDFFMSGGNTTSNTFGNGTIYIPNYTAQVNKSMSIDFVNENNATGAFSAMQRIVAALWSNTAPVTSAQFVANSGSNFVAGTTISLYGVKRGSDGVTLPAATGGVVTTSGGYTIHTFNTSGTFTAFRPLQCEYLVIAGGGGGGSYQGGGGAGGYRTSVGTSGGGQAAEANLSISTGPYLVTLGSGGAGGAAGLKGSNGVNSTFDSVTSLGGGAGGGRNSLEGANNGNSGGSGGAAGHSGTIGAGTFAQGFNGGAFSNNISEASGGGGGASQAGASGSGSQAGNGGAGVASSITGSSVTRGGGGGGGGYATNGAVAGAGGAGGGGNGSATSDGTPGSANTGGGGGAAGATPGNARIGGTGGSGVVIIRYLTP